MKLDLDDDVMCDDRLDFKTWKRHILSDEPGLRTEAADMLPKDARARDVIPYLLRCLEDEADLVRTCAADTLRHFPRDAVRQRLIERLDVETDDLTVSYLLSSLGEIGGVEEIPILLRYLQSDENQRLSQSAAYGLQCCAENIAKARIISALKSRNEGRQVSAANLIRHTIDKRCTDAEDLITAVQKRVDSAKHRGPGETFEKTLHDLRDTYDEDYRGCARKAEPTEK